MHQIFTKILEIVFRTSTLCLNKVAEIEATVAASDINDSELGFIHAQMSSIDPFQMKVMVVSLLLFAIILVCRKIVTLDQAVSRA